MNPKVAIIVSGFGMYCLLPAFSNTSGCKVVSICGKNSKRMSNFCKKFTVSHYDDWKKMLYEEKPDIIAVAVVPKYQFEIIKFALENKIAVFAEKPLTTNYQNSLELYELSKKYNLANMIDFEFPQIPEWIEAKSIIENGKIGKIMSIELDWTFLSYDLANGIKSWKTNVKEGGGALSLVFSHTFYYLEHFLGKIKNINCSLSSSDKSLNHGDTKIDMQLIFESGCKGNIHVDISDDTNHKHIIKFIGTNGELILENLSNNFLDNFELKIKKNGEIQKISDIEKLTCLNDVDEDPRIKFITNLTNKFIHWYNTGMPAKPNFEDGLRVQKLIEISRKNNIE